MPKQNIKCDCWNCRIIKSLPKNMTTDDLGGLIFSICLSARLDQTQMMHIFTNVLIAVDEAQAIEKMRKGGGH